MSPDKRVESFTVGSAWLKDSAGLRLDASFYNPRAARAIDALKRSGIPLKTLGEVTERIFIPGRFARTYVDKDHGLPFLQGSHVVHFQPADLKYVSPTVHKKLDLWVIREGWLLVTRSGSVGRVAVTPHSWDGWAASEHILRIVPKRKGPCPVGYLYAFLSSEFGQAQLTAQIYGAVVDELTEDQTRSVLIPVAETPKQLALVKKLSETAMQAVELRAKAVGLAEQAVSTIDDLVPRSPDDTEETTEYDRFESFARKVVNAPRSVLDEAK